jgi:hypothetical protein
MVGIRLAKERNYSGLEQQITAKQVSLVVTPFPKTPTRINPELFPTVLVPGRIIMLPIFQALLAQGVKQERMALGIHKCLWKQYRQV